MAYPLFFDQVEPIGLEDALGEFLGAFEDGRLEISYYDCAKLAGHSCPTVASAYLMAKAGLGELFGDRLPKRSKIKVEMRSSKDEGVTGVIAAVISYIAGANDEGGFKGIGGNFSRNNLLSFDAPIQGMVRLSDIESGSSVEISVDTKSVPGSPDMMPLMQKSLQGMASVQERKKFQALWQARVEAMLLDKQLQQKIIKISK